MTVEDSSVLLVVGWMTGLETPPVPTNVETGVAVEEASAEVCSVLVVG